jgi:UDP-N-acetylglucosamine--N-acetylmuramyl-(pentapeptide) pyrophosphoryl-undecaprenol N-acetylglucosamine transferase
LFVFGGSLGAQRLNLVVPHVAADLATENIQVLHVCGNGKSVEVAPSPAGRPAYVVLEYVDRMDLAYAAADLVVGRAGANTVSEITALGLPAIFVPLPIGNGEQRLNAEPIVAGGGGLLVDDTDFDAAWLRANLLPLLTDPAACTAMGLAAASFGRLDADIELARLVGEAVAAR